MSDQPYKPTMQSMGAVGNGNGHHDDDGESIPPTTFAPRSEMKTPPGGVSRETYLDLPQDDKNSLIYEEMVAMREESTRAEFARAGREESRKKSYETREEKRDAIVDALGGKIDASINDARSDRMSHANDRAEWRAAVVSLSKTQLAFDAQLAKMPAAITDAVTKAVTAAVGKQIDNLNERYDRKLAGIVQQLGDNNEGILRANGRITSVDDRVDEVAMRQVAHGIAHEAMRNEIGTVPHEVDVGSSLTDRSPEAAKKRDENAKVGTGIKGQLARHDKNVVSIHTKSAALLMLGGAGATGLAKIAETYGIEWSAVAVAAGSLVGVLGVGAKRAVDRARAWIVARRIKVSEATDGPEKNK